MSGRIRLGVNIDHVATVRNARGGSHPEPLRAAECAMGAGADGITAHLREDRRHIVDEDIIALKNLCSLRGVPLNFEMAATPDMVAIALKTRPHAACLVPERRLERTTEGGLDGVTHLEELKSVTASLKNAGIRVSLFIATDSEQIKAASQIGADIVEFHTGALCEALRDSHKNELDHQLDRLHYGSRLAHDLGIEVHAGHGIDYQSVSLIAKVPEICELNIGHFLIGEAIFTGLVSAIRRMRVLMNEARGLEGAQ